MLDIYESRASTRHDLDYDELVTSVVEKVRLAEREARVPTRSMPVIFTPKGFSNTLAMSLQMAFNGKLVWQGASPLRGRLGERVFDPKLTLCDDGQLPFGVASAPFDDEGVPTRRTMLVDRGVVSHFFYDLQTAALAGTESTGNAHRELGSLPGPSPHAWIISPGNTPFAEMLANIKEGLLVDQVMGAWSGNVLGGEFSGNVHLGFKIENGELVGRVKDTMIAGNVFTALAEVASIGDTSYWVGGSLHVPHLCLPALGVASKTG